MLFVIKDILKQEYYTDIHSYDYNKWDKQLRKAKIYTSYKMACAIRDNPKFINIFCDNDSVGLKTGFILHKFFNIIGINNKTIVSEKFKDASEHIFQNKMNMDTIVDISINLSMIDESTNDFNLGSYLKNRKFN